MKRVNSRKLIFSVLIVVRDKHNNGKNEWIIICDGVINENIVKTCGQLVRHIRCTCTRTVPYCIKGPLRWNIMNVFNWTVAKVYHTLFLLHTFFPISFVVDTNTSKHGHSAKNILKQRNWFIGMARCTTESEKGGGQRRSSIVV